MQIHTHTHTNEDMVDKQINSKVSKILESENFEIIPLKSGPKQLPSFNTVNEEQGKNKMKRITVIKFQRKEVKQSILVDMM